MSRHRLASLAVAGVLVTTVAGAQASAPSTAADFPTNLSIPVGLQLGLPQGEFAENVAVAGGIGGALLWHTTPWLALRLEFGVSIYGAETRRVPLGGGALGLINVDVTTTNTIIGGGIGAQIGVPRESITPYLGGTIGFSAFTTSSSVSGSNSSDVPFANSTNSSDGAFAKTALAGLYIPLARGVAQLDLGLRYNWNGERVRYLTPGDIIEDVNGDIVLTPRESRADLLTIVLGVAIRPSRAGR